MKRIDISQVTNKVLVCPYCMTQVNESSLGHCGESSAHFEYGYELNNGEIYLKSELTIDDSLTG